MQFEGFPEAGLKFLEDLAQNNNRTWFQANKQMYERQLLRPAQSFVATLGERLHSIAPQIRFDTRTNGSGTLMRIYRDTRFSKDKTPYKTNISGLFWEGEGKKTACPAFGFQLSPTGLELMAGMFAFSKPQLAAFRAAVDDDGLGSELVAMLAKLTTADTYHLAGTHYKRVPRGYDPDHPRADLLRHNALYVRPSAMDPAVALSPGVVDRCMVYFEAMAPVQQWLVRVFNT